MLLSQPAHRRLLIAGVVVHPQGWETLAPRFHPIHPALKGLPLFNGAVGPPGLELRVARGVAIAGPKQVFELGAGHRVLDPLHVEPDVPVIGCRQCCQTFSGDDGPQTVGRPSIRPRGGELKFSLLPELMQGLGTQARNHSASRHGRQRVDGGDSGGAQLEALALAHVGHQHQVALIRQALVDKGAPAAVITGHVLRDHLRIERFSKSAVALTQQLVPGPELISAVALEAATTEVEIKVIGPVAQ